MKHSTVNRRTNVRRPNRPPNRRQRRGTLVVCVLGCMAVVAGLLAFLAKDALQARRETKLRFQMQQTERLLDAGILRASRQLEKDPSFEGETWEPKLSLHGQTIPTTVTISAVEDKLMVTARIGVQPNTTTQSHTFPKKLF